MSAGRPGGRGTISYTYDAADRVQSSAVSGGPTASYTHYDDGSVKTIQWTAPGGGTFSYTYKLTGQYDTITFPNTQTRSYSYDNQGRLTQVANLGPGGNLATYAYGYDVDYNSPPTSMLGQRTSLTATVPFQAFAGSQTKYYYDANYQLKKVDYPGVAPYNAEVDQWSYDDIGNRLTNQMNSTTQTYTYYKNGGNPLNGQRLKTDGSGYTYGYDANGNLTSRTPITGPVYAANWDFENRLTSYGGSGGPLTAGYDYLGWRKTRTVAGLTSTYLYDGQNLVGNTTAGTYFLYGPGIDEPLAMSAGGSLYYYCVDGLGSVTLLNDAGGTIKNSYVLDAWGNARAQTTTVSNPLTYTAREGADVGLFFYRARYYNPSIGRFISEDSLRYFEGPSFYRYVSNKPSLLTDPSGHTIYICARKAEYPFTWLDANHTYIWNDKNGSCCDKAGGAEINTTKPCSEKGPPFDSYTPVPDSDGHEWEIMSCCWNDAMDSKMYITETCQGFAKDCVERRGYKYPGSPGGLTGPPCDKCPKQPPAIPPDIPPGPPCSGDARLC